MPRNVRNFWLECEIDGRASNLSGGPVQRDGGFFLTIYMRDRGTVSEVGWIKGSYNRNQKSLLLTWTLNKSYGQYRTRRESIAEDFVPSER